MDLDLLAIGLVALLLAAGSAGLLFYRRRRQLRDTAAWHANVEKKLHVPQSLHPVVDTDVCIGSLSCIRACPEGDILGIVSGAARLVHASNCIGHGRCAAECPVGAIRLVFGTSERGVDLPEVDEFFESSRPGVHVVGELGGMGLIKNAFTQGLQVAARLAVVLKAEPVREVRRPAAGIALAGGGRGESVPGIVTAAASPGPRLVVLPDDGGRRAPAATGDGIVDVAIVGAGPAGLAAAAALREAGLGFRVLEQGTMGGTVAQYPRHKVVMTEPVALPFAGKLSKRLVSKEELVAWFEKLVDKAGIRIEEGTRVLGVEGEDGDFVVKTDRGEVRARKVVLATGRRGTPRKLGAAGEELPKVTYRLIDPEQYEGARVLVVGGGDAALEAANSLADAGVATTISYRGPAFGRCRPANKEGIERRIAAGRIDARMSTEVERIEEGRVLLKGPDGATVLGNDHVIVLIGGELPLEFLQKAGVQVRRLHGEGAGKPAAPGVRRGPTKEERETRRRRFLALGLGTLGACIVAALAWTGRDYYLLAAAERLRSPLHESLRPAGNWGHGVGIVATLFMLSNFLYAVRKRWGRLKGTGTIRTWLTFHMFVGFMSPVVIAFHAAFQSNNGLATATAASLAVVVGTGIVGRFIYGLVPVAGGKTEELADLAARLERQRDAVRPLLAHLADPRPAEALLATVTAAPRGGSLFTLLARLPAETVGLRLRLRSLRPLFADPADFAELRGSLVRLVKLRRQVGFYRSLKRLLAGWRLFHASLAVFLVLVITAHIALALYLGYGWILL